MNQRNTLANNPNTTSKNSVGKTPMKSVKKSQSMSVDVDDAGQGTSNAKMKKAINKYSRERNLPLTRVRRIMESSPSTDEQKLTGEAIHGMARATVKYLKKKFFQVLLTAFVKFYLRKHSLRCWQGEHIRKRPKPELIITMFPNLSIHQRN